MKKIISVVLSLAMVLSVFVSTLVYAANNNGLVYDSATETYTYTMGSTNQLITGSTYSIDKARLFGFGKWNISATETGITELGTLTKISKYGKNYVEYDFNGVTITDSDNAAGNYIRFKTNGKDSGIGLASANVITIAKTVYDAYLTDENQIYKYTFYAYSDSTDTENNMLNVNVSTGTTLGTNISPAQLYSANGVPHKVDFILHKKDGILYQSIYIDGAVVAGGNSTTTMTAGFTFTNYLASVKCATSGTYTSPAVKWVVEYIGDNDKYSVEELTRDELAEELFVIPTAGSKTENTARTDDIITGVYDDVDAALVETLTSTTLGDKKIVIPAKYTTVGSLFDGTETNVKAIKADGSAAVSEDLVEDVMLMVNGVYVDVEREPLVKGLTVNSDGLATLTYDYTSGMFIVAAYDDGGRVINVNSADISKESAEEIDSMHIYTLQSSLTSGVKKYKAFLFDGFVNCIPMLNSAEITN